MRRYRWRDNIQRNAKCTNTNIHVQHLAIYMYVKYMVYSQPTDLFALSVRGGVVCDLEVVEVEYVLHLIVVSSSLADNDSHIKQKDVSVK